MVIKIIWSDFAKNEIREIYLYYKHNTSESLAKKIIKNLTKSTNKLVFNLELGQIEKYINHEKTFRYFLVGHFKIIYFIDLEKNIIYITDVFDTRQSEEKLNRNAQ